MNVFERIGAVIVYALLGGCGLFPHAVIGALLLAWYVFSTVQ